MTPQQKSLLDFIRTYIREHEYSPSYEEMMSHVGCASKGTIHRLTQALVLAGHLRRRPASHRGLEVVEGAAPGDMAGIVARATEEAITAHGFNDGDGIVLAFTEAEFRAFMAPLIVAARR